MSRPRTIHSSATSRRGRSKRSTLPFLRVGRDGVPTVGPMIGSGDLNRPLSRYVPFQDKFKSRAEALETVLSRTFKPNKER